MPKRALPRGKQPVRQGIFICFTGIDGVGKTTLAKALTKWMNDEGVPCKYVYNRLGTFLLKPFMIITRKLLLKGEDPFKNYIKYSNAKTVSYTHLTLPTKA